MRNRWYDPNTGRFTQEDPIGYAGGSNLYAYAGNDSVNYADPFGLCPVCVVAAAYALYEIGSGIYDGYQAVKTLFSDASAGEKATTVGLALAGTVLPGGGYTAAGKAVIRYSDDVVDLSLRGRSLTSGSKALRELGLTERITKTGRHEFVDDNGRVRAAYDAANSKGGNHWHKFASDGRTPLNNAGRGSTRTDRQLTSRPSRGEILTTPQIRGPKDEQDFHDSSLLDLQVGPQLDTIRAVVSTLASDGRESLWMLTFAGVLWLEYETVGDGLEFSDEVPLEVYSIFNDRESAERRRWVKRLIQLGVAQFEAERVWHVVFASSYARGWGENESLEGLQIICRRLTVERAPPDYRGSEFKRPRIEADDS